MQIDADQMNLRGRNPNASQLLYCLVPAKSVQLDQPEIMPRNIRAYILHVERITCVGVHGVSNLSGF